MGSKMMKIGNYSCYNGETIIEVDVNEKIKQHLERAEEVLFYLRKLDPAVEKEYIVELNRLMLEKLDDSKSDGQNIYNKPIDSKYNVLSQYPGLISSIIEFVIQSYDLVKQEGINLEKAKITSYNRVKALEHLSYYRVKAFTNILGKEKGLKLYSTLLANIVKDKNNSSNINQNPSHSENREGAIKWWCKEGIADFTAAYEDDYKTLFRFDRCLTHEVLKEFNDPDVAYTCSCFIGDIKEFNENKIIHMRRTQTLHYGDFCDELYWDTRIHQDPEQPSLDFTRKLGKK